MLKLIKFLIFPLIFIAACIHPCVCKGQSVNTIDKAVKDAGDNILKGLKKPIPAESKIAITFFKYDNALTDTLKTYLGIRISKQLYLELKKRVLSKNLKFIVLFPENTDKMLNATMNDYFIPPSTDQQLDVFYKSLMISEKPDFYLTGSYRIKSDYSALVLTGMELVPNRFDTAVNKIRSIAFADVEEAIESQDDRKLIAGLNHEISRIPDWVDYSKRNSGYPAGDYLCSFLSEKVSSPDQKESVVSRLAKESVDQLEENIHQSLILPSGTTGSETKRSASTFSRLDPSVFQTLNYFDDTRQMVYVFSFSKKNDLAANCKTQYKQKLAELKKLVNDASRSRRDGNQILTLKIYSRSFLLFRQLEEIQAVIFAIVNPPESAELSLLRKEVDKGLADLKKSTFSNLDDLCQYLAVSFNVQVTNLSDPVILKPPTYQELSVTSPFSLRFQSVFGPAIASNTGYKIISQDIPEACNTISGNYWEENEQLRVVMNLRGKNNIILASSEARLPLDYLKQNNISVKPENFEAGLQNLKEINLAQEKQGDLQVAVTTNKGNINPYYRKDEIMQIFIKTNKICYLRVVYYLADGKKILLLDNYQVTQDNVNKVFSLPEKFICNEPFGVETLQLFAQSFPFESLATKLEAGRQYILDNTPAICYTSTRGFSIITEFAEKKIVMTTMP
ncbi:MAG: hypothetical protein NTW49_10720 [Bacteroidia bacterium]|nr:hypothetical protein [Bacteroidia bacterium]